MDELAVRLRARPDRAPDPQRTRARSGDRPAVLRPQPPALLARRRPPVRLGTPRPHAGHPPRGRLAGGHGGGGVHVSRGPDARLAGGDPVHRRPVCRADRRRRHRHRRLDDPRADRRRRPVGARSTPSSCRSATPRSRPPPWRECRRARSSWGSAIIVGGTGLPRRAWAASRRGAETRPGPDGPDRTAPDDRDAQTTRTARDMPCIRSAPSSPRCGCMPTPARSGSTECSASSTRAGSSTRGRPAHSSSAG